MSGTPVTSSPIAGSLGTYSDTSLFNYFQAVLTQLGAPLTYENYVALGAWSACEGTPADQGGYNPLNTTLKGDTLAGSAGDLGNNPQQNGGDPVKNYDGWSDGVGQTVATIQGHPGITSALQNGDNAQNVAAMVGASGWGTNPTCILSTIADFLAHPAELEQQLALPVNTNSTDQGGSGSSADAGGANPESDGLPTASGVLGSLGGILEDLTSKQWLDRVGIFVLGAALFIIGVVGFVATSDTGQKVIGEAAPIAAVA